MSGPLRLGVIGAGNVCEHYLPKLAAYPDIDLRIIGDRHPDRASARAAEHGIPRSGSVDDVLSSADVEAVLDLTPPAAHLDLGLATLEAGKHLYSEKPLAMDPSGAGRLVAAATARGLVVGSAPDVMLAPGFQAALRALDEGAIGSPVFSRCAAVLAGPESWHPRPQFLFARGGGPLFDIGPYYLTAIVAALGPVESVVAAGTRRSTTRVIGSGDLAGTEFAVEVPTLVAAVLTLRSGITATVLLTFDSASHRGGSMEILGTGGTLALPDPNGGDPDAAVLAAGSESWQPVTWRGEFSALGPGVVNFARAIRGEEPLVVDGARAAHIVDVMDAIAESAETGDRVGIDSAPDAPSLLPSDWDPRRPTL